MIMLMSATTFWAVGRNLIALGPAILMAILDYCGLEGIKQVVGEVVEKHEHVPRKFVVAKATKAAEAYKAEFMCEVEPMLAILEKVACACAADRSTQAEACEGVFSQIAQTTVASKTIFIQEAGEEQQQIVTSPAGSIMITLP